MRVFTYVITVDDGSAPSYDLPHVTLAVCKPQIRKGARPGDLLVAFAGRTLSPEPHAVVWAGVVNETMGFAAYWQDPRFQNKKPGASAVPDNIYRPEARGFVQVPNSTHGPEHTPRDLGGESVLVFSPAWYAGALEVVMPDGLGLRMPAAARRGHRVVTLSQSEGQALIEWLEDEMPRWEGPERVPVGRRGGKGC